MSPFNSRGNRGDDWQDFNVEMILGGLPFQARLQRDDFLILLQLDNVGTWQVCVAEVSINVIYTEPSSSPQPHKTGTLVRTLD